MGLSVYQSTCPCGYPSVVHLSIRPSGRPSGVDKCPSISVRLKGFCRPSYCDVVDIVIVSESILTYKAISPEIIITYYAHTESLTKSHLSYIKMPRTFASPPARPADGSGMHLARPPPAHPFLTKRISLTPSHMVHQTCNLRGIMVKCLNNVPLASTL